ncbi:LacI family DNA-binding transcriptional regulator [Botryobacter ruber]|uniref:LacI family DNA-binding transcriptional regulator n=1 Tax=Botryobacter ruber TaxID=2171629 RepID=UPI000E0BD845|nr:substrate-binding domain-containing protein [Botryobacter ruber]
MKKISLKDIAEQLEVSKTTVSFVLNGKAKENHISESLTQKILKYVEEVGYVPNQLARGLRTGETKVIGVLVEDISDPFFSSIARRIEEEANSKGYKIVYCSTENNADKTKELLEVYKSRQVDGFIIAPPPGIEKEIQALQKSNLPVVLFDRYFPEVATDTVVVENQRSSYNATNHLLHNGYKQIAFITLASEQVQMQDRLQGYKEAMEEQHLAHYIQKIPFDLKPKKITKEIQAFLEQHPNIDAVFFATNYLADSGLEAIQNLGLEMPADIGVVVFDDEKLFRLFRPPITAIAQPIKEIAKSIVSLLLDKLTGAAKKNDYKKVELSTTLYERASSVPVLAASR